MIGEGRDHFQTQIHRQKLSAQGALLTLSGSVSQEAGHESVPSATPALPPSLPSAHALESESSLAPRSAGLPATLTLFCDSLSSRDNFSEEPVEMENLTLQNPLSKKQEKDFLWACRTQANCSQQPPLL